MPDYKRYAGHYVVLCGYDMAAQKLFYHNPEVHDGRKCFDFCHVESFH